MNLLAVGLTLVAIPFIAGLLAFLGAILVDGYRAAMTHRTIGAWVDAIGPSMVIGGLLCIIASVILRTVQ